MNFIFFKITCIIGFIITVLIWRFVQFGQFPVLLASVIITVPILLVFPTSWIGRKVLDFRPTIKRVAWITSFVHILLMIFFGVSIIEAISLFQRRPGLIISFPVELAKVLLYITGLCLSLTVINLAISGVSERPLLFH